MRTSASTRRAITSLSVNRDASEAIVTRLAALEQHNARLEATITDLAARVALSERRRRVPSDAARDAALLSAVAKTFGGAVFSTADLVARAAHDSELAAVLDGLDVRRVGAWLRRIKGGAGAYRLERIGRDDRGTLWAVCAHLHTADSHPADRPA